MGWDRVPRRTEAEVESSMLPHEVQDDDDLHERFVFLVLMEQRLSMLSVVDKLRRQRRDNEQELKKQSRLPVPSLSVS